MNARTKRRYFWLKCPECGKRFWYKRGTPVQIYPVVCNKCEEYLIWRSEVDLQEEYRLAAEPLGGVL